ncbi:hypothetical protein F4778DRAFT_523127 [Xylariomycetidae sp. FL2044]|nr:hypothetical protein F4778DRAFT_523127 [Xylariomycetidae sp. FL2044]
MANRGFTMPHLARAPLGDATTRVNNAPPPPKLAKHDRVQDPEPNPLRAHPTNTSSRKASRPGPAPSSTVKGPDTRGPGVTSRQSSRLSKDPSDTDKRNSQASNSSGTSSSKRKTHIGPWHLGSTLGKGTAARVRQARHSVTNELVAVKILSKNHCHMSQAGSLAELDKWDRSREEYTKENHMPLAIEREVALLKLIDHPNIVKLYDIWENRSEIYLVLEFMERGDLYNYINTQGPLPEVQTMFFFRQLLSAMEYVHSFNICHRDLKPENILLKSNGQLKIADFGMSALQQSPTHTLKTACGSPHYAAPEVVTHTRYRGDLVDVWSLGVIFYACLCGRLPFDHPVQAVMLEQARRAKYSLPDFVSPGARKLLHRMLQPDPKNRITTKRIWQLPFVCSYDELDDLNDGVDLIESRKEMKCNQVPVEDLDMQILRQLKAMWHTFSEKDLAMKLTNSEPNDQKLFYWLLFDYREKQLENFDSGLSYSASDYHHLRPANWKKKFTTVQFPAQYGRTASRFTVISNVATDASGEAIETATDGGTTVKSYDPYKSSLVMGGDPPSHANIIVHRNGSVARDSTRASGLQARRNRSIRSTSTYASRASRGTRRIPPPTELRASRRSVSSIKSAEGSPYQRPASRPKRGVDFSSIHKRPMNGQREQTHRPPASIACDDKTYERDCASPTSPAKRTRTSTNSRGRARAGTKSMANIPRDKNDNIRWNEELRHFSRSIAKDCDEAFNSSLLSAPSYLESSPFAPSIPADARSLSVSLATPATPTPTAASARDPKVSSRPWDARPLPPVPPPTDSVLREIKAGKRRAELMRDDPDESPGHVEKIFTHLNTLSRVDLSSPREDADRRHVSAPIYSQYSTRWGRDKIQLPAITEGQREDSLGGGREPSRVVSAPVQSSSALRDMQAGADLDYLAQQKETIRFVQSPSTKAPAPVPRAKLSRYPQTRQDLDLRQQYTLNESPAQVSEDPTAPTKDTAAVGIKKKSSWFKRSSKSKEDIVKSDSKQGSTSDLLTHTDTNSSTGRPAQPEKKKSFNIAFWRHSKDETEMRMSLGGPEYDDSPSADAVRMFSHPQRPPREKRMKQPAENRNIEPQQSWLARLFRVKPATKHLCFAISKRRARQEIAILLKEWRQHGIKDLQVDKARNIVFARVGKHNVLHIKEVSFAAEIMTVIEHGKHHPLSIVRFTQEKGAASSFHKVMKAVHDEFTSRHLLVINKQRAKMMVKTLYA